MVEARCIDERSEWRSFGDKVTLGLFLLHHEGPSCGSTLLACITVHPFKPVQFTRRKPRSCSTDTAFPAFQDGGAGVDPNRVGGPTNHLLANDLATDIGQGRGTAAMMQTLKRTAFQAGSDPDKALSQAFRRINLLCESLGLLRVIYDTACELYKKVHTAGVVRGRALASVIPAVVFIACRKEQTPSTLPVTAHIFVSGVLCSPWLGSTPVSKLYALAANSQVATEQESVFAGD